MVFLRKILHLFRIFILILLGPLSFWNGSRRLRKWVKKNEREQDSTLYPYDERWTYIRKKVKKINKRLGIKINTINIDNLPKGASWIVANHSSNFDGLYLIEALGAKTNLLAIVKHTLKNSKFSNGYIIGSDSYFLDRSSPRSSMNTLNNATNFAKKNNRSLVISPEGTRSLTTELKEFKVGSFKFPQKYALPIVPVVITGTMQARSFLRLKTVVINVEVLKPIKSIDHIKLPTEILSRNIREKINKSLIKYENSLKGKEKIEWEKLKKKSISLEEKKNIKLKKEIKKEHEKHSKNNRKKSK